MSYSVSDPLPCQRLDSNYRDAKHECVCYSVNSRNRMGGYAGGEIKAMSMTGLDGFWFAVGTFEIRQAAGIRACSEANFTDRSGDKIKMHVRK